MTKMKSEENVVEKTIAINVFFETIFPSAIAMVYNQSLLAKKM